MWTSNLFSNFPDLPLLIHSIPNGRKKFLLGYRAVPKKIGEEYLEQGTLTAVQANGIQLGEDAYLSPVVADWSASDSNWQCAVFVDADKLVEVPKLYIPPYATRDRFYLFDAEGAHNRESYIALHGFDPAHTILASFIAGDGQTPRRQIMIPPAFLKKRQRGLYSMPGAGTSDLGIVLDCGETAQMRRYTDVADWTIFGDWDLAAFNTVGFQG